jgi:hypothetical protein
MSKFISKYAKCPFYHRHDDNRICCEGLDASHTINVVFEVPAKLKEYEMTHCNDIGSYRRCRIYQMLDRNWREKYGE